jgi:hypothetical protein
MLQTFIIHLLGYFEAQLDAEKRYSKSEILDICNETQKNTSKNKNNETSGQTAEYAICKHFGINCDISESRIDSTLCEKIIQLLPNVYFKARPIESIGSKNGKTDFKCEGGKTLSVKSLMKNEGKICPQTIGQPTLKKWDSNNETGFNGYLGKNEERLDIIKENILAHLNDYLKHTFCCDDLLLISNCNKTPIVEFLSKINNEYFNDKDVYLTRPEYEEKWNEKKQKTSEYSSQVKMNLSGDDIVVGEFQFHKNSRKQIKFRFYKTFLKNAHTLSN